MITFRNYFIGAVAAAVVGAPIAANADQMFILYTDSGVAWRIGQHDHEAERRQIELDYAQDVQNARDDYDAAVAEANQSNDQQDMLVAANQRLQNDLQVAEDRRISRLDSLYPNRWNDIDNYPDLLIVGYSGPCHFCEFDIESGAISWLEVLQPYPGYSKPCLFGWQYGQRHQFGDVRVARSNYKIKFEANLRQHPQSSTAVAFGNANRWVQSKGRSDKGTIQEDDVKFMSNHHLPPVKPNTPPIPRAPSNGGRNAPKTPIPAHVPSYVPRATNPGRSSSKSAPPAQSYIPRANNNVGTNGRNTTPARGNSNAGKGGSSKPAGGSGSKDNKRGG